MNSTPEALARILGDMPQYRLNNAKLEVSDGKDPQYFVRVYVDSFDKEGSPIRPRRRIYLGPVSQGPRAAEKARRELLATVNNSMGILQNQILFRRLVEIFEKDHIPTLNYSTQTKYKGHLKNHIRPAWDEVALYQVTTRKIEAWLKAKAEAGLSWHTRQDIKNIMSAVFTMAMRYGMWNERNPAEGVQLGRKVTVRKPQKLTLDQTRIFLEMLPDDVRIICEVGLFCSLRISEVLGLQWKDLDFERQTITVDGRYWRGDYDGTKSDAGERVAPMSLLFEKLSQLKPGEPDDYVFSVKTKYGYTRDDSVIRKNFLKKVAKAMGIDHPGFGFHSFRREGITELANSLNQFQLMKLAGHASAKMTDHYNLPDLEAQRAAVTKFMEKVRTQ